AFALDGKHEGVACRKCHTGISAPEVPLGRKVVDYGGARRECVACHGDKDPHKGEFGRVCESCHKTTTFGAKDFKHPRAPDFFGGQHEHVACEKCHVPGKALQPFRTGASGAVIAAIASPSTAPGAAVPAKAPLMECASCHDTATFAMSTYTHRVMEDFFGGFHGRYACKECHKSETGQFPAGRGTAVRLMVGRACSACHRQ